MVKQTCFSFSFFFLQTCFFCAHLCPWLCSVAQSYLTLCDPICSPPGSSVHAIVQARVLVWVAISFSRGSSQPRDQTCVSYIGRQGVFFVFCFLFNHLASGEAQLKGISHISFSYLQFLSGISYSIIYFVPLLCLCQKRVTWFGAKSSFQEWTQGELYLPPLCLKASHVLSF